MFITSWIFIHELFGMFSEQGSEPPRIMFERRVNLFEYILLSIFNKVFIVILIYNSLTQLNKEKLSWDREVCIRYISFW